MTGSDNIYRRSLDMIKSLILETFRDDDIRIMLFGSRARGDSTADLILISGYCPEKITTLKN